MNGRRGPDTRCRKYVIGPIIAAKEERNSIEPNDHLRSDGPLAYSYSGAYRPCGG